ncbi:hypothetical protein ACQ4PT_057112 [Festuca glaucescens]
MPWLLAIMPAMGIADAAARLLGGVVGVTVLEDPLLPLPEPRVVRRPLFSVAPTSARRSRTIAVKNKGIPGSMVKMAQRLLMKKLGICRDVEHLSADQLSEYASIFQGCERGSHYPAFQEGLLLNLDVARAFDSVAWPFLISVLRHRGFGPRLNLLDRATCQHRVYAGIGQRLPWSGLLP